MDWDVGPTAHLQLFFCQCRLLHQARVDSVSRLHLHLTEELEGPPMFQAGGVEMSSLEALCRVLAAMPRRGWSHCYQHQCRHAVISASHCNRSSICPNSDAQTLEGVNSHRSVLVIWCPTRQ
jgi:hypothetical protein